MDLSGASSIVTGASSGIGRAIAIEFARRGARVVLAARNAPALEEVAQRIRGAGGTGVVVPTDVTAPQDVENLVNETIRQLGGIDILVNNAGIGMHATIADGKAEDVQHVFAVNVLAASSLIRAVIPWMRAQRRGTVVNISSVAGRIVPPRVGYYSATKFALTAIGTALRMEEGHHGVRVINVFPGFTQSRFSENQLGRAGRASHQMVMGVPAEKVARRVARAVRWNQRTVYVSFFPDQVGVAVNRLAPWLVSGALSRWARYAAPGES